MHQKEPRTHSTTLGSDNFILISNGSQGAIVRPVEVCVSLPGYIVWHQLWICQFWYYMFIANLGPHCWTVSPGLARARQSSQATLVKAVSICLIRDILISNLQEVIFVRVLGGCSGCGTHLLHQGGVFCAHPVPPSRKEQIPVLPSSCVFVRVCLCLHTYLYIN